MRTSTHSFKFLLSIVVFCFFAALPARAQTEADLLSGFGSFQGNTVDELSAKFRDTEGARGWTVGPEKREGALRTRMVSWSYNYEATSNFKFLLVNGRTEMTFYTCSDKFFKSFESALNRTYRARNADQWVDAARNTWTLARVPGTGSLVLQVARTLR